MVRKVLPLSNSLIMLTPVFYLIFVVYAMM